VDVTRQSTVFAMGLACLFGGILGQPILNYLFNVSFVIDPAAYAQKAFIFSLSLATGVLLYRAVIQKLDLSGLVRRLDVSFRGVCIAMGLFLFGLLAYLRFFM
jgi:multicomponent Na+:H+ antiporter subunit D